MTKKDKQPAIDALSKVVKLDPSMPDAWNTMAECYWQGGDYDMAQKCLENSLKQVRIYISDFSSSFVFVRSAYLTIKSSFRFTV